MRNGIELTKKHTRPRAQEGIEPLERGGGRGLDSVLEIS